MTGLVEQEPYLKIKKLFDEKKFDDGTYFKIGYSEQFHD